MLYKSFDFQRILVRFGKPNIKQTMNRPNSHYIPANAIPIIRIWGRREHAYDRGGNGDNKALRKSEESNINFPLYIIMVHYMA